MQLNKSLQDCEDYQIYFQNILNEHPITQYQNYGVLSKREQAFAEKQIYKMIINKVDSKNYSSMLTQLSQKTMKNDLKFENFNLEDYKVNLKLFLMDKIVAECVVPVNNSKKTKSVFCLQVLLDDFPEFLKELYQSVKDKSMSRSFNISKSTIANNDQSSSFFFENYMNQSQQQKRVGITASTNDTLNTQQLSFNGFQSKEQDQSCILQNKSINSDTKQTDVFSKIYKEFNKEYPPKFSSISHSDTGNFQFKLKNNYSYSILLKMQKFQDIVKTIAKDHQIKLSTQMIKKKQYISAKFILKIPEKKQVQYKLVYLNDYQKESLTSVQVTEYFYLNFIKDFIPQIYNELEQQNTQTFEENDQEDEQYQHLWDLFQKDQNLQGSIHQIMYDDLTGLKKDIKRDGTDLFLNFGDKHNFDNICEYFQKINYIFKQSQLKESNNYIIEYEIMSKVNQQRYKITLDLQSKGHYEAMLIGQAKFIETVFGQDFFSQYIQNYIENKQQDIQVDELFFNKFDLCLQEPIDISEQIHVQQERLEQIYEKIQEEKQDYDYEETLEELFEDNYQINLEQDEEGDVLNLLYCLVLNKQQDDELENIDQENCDDFDDSNSNYQNSRCEIKDQQRQISIKIKTLNNKDVEDTQYMKFAVLQVLRYFDKNLFIKNLSSFNQLICYYYFFAKIFFQIFGKSTIHFSIINFYKLLNQNSLRNKSLNIIYQILVSAKYTQIALISIKIFFVFKSLCFIIKKYSIYKIFIL